MTRPPFAFLPTIDGLEDESDDLNGYGLRPAEAKAKLRQRAHYSVPDYKKPTYLGV